MTDYSRGQCPTCQRVLGLTKRQWQFAELVHKGKADREIAVAMRVTVRSAKCMVERIRITLRMPKSTRGTLILRLNELFKDRESLGPNTFEIHHAMRPGMGVE